MLSYTMTPKSLNICIDGSMFTIDQTHANYNAIREALKRHSNIWSQFDKDLVAQGIKDLCDIKKFIAMWTRGDVEVGADAVLYKGQPVSGVIATRLISMVSEGFSPEPLAAFLAKLQANPAEHARNELYLWLETSNLPICEDGDFLAFKSVRDDYLSHHDGVTNNSIGTILEMPREDVDPERDNTCSTGFHFCSMDYLSTYGGGSRIVILKINPADVVSIPSDYNNKKGRAWRYLVVDEVKSARVADYEFNGVSVAKADAVTGVGMSDKYMHSATDQFFDGYDSHRTAEIAAEIAAEGDSAACECSDASAPPLGNFVVSSAREFVEDDIVEGLWTAFTWNDTPQGANFWRSIVDGKASAADVARGKAIVRHWLEAYGDVTVDPGVSDNDDENVQIFGGDDDSDFDENATVYVYEEPTRGERYETTKFGSGVRLTKGDRTITLSELKAMLKEHGQRGTARLTGIPRTTIQEWIARYNLA